MIRDELSILVVDDMKFSCEFIRRALTKEGYTSIEVVNNALDALKRIKKSPYDVGAGRLADARNGRPGNGPENPPAG